MTVQQGEVVIWENDTILVLRGILNISWIGRLVQGYNILKEEVIYGTIQVLEN